MSDIDPTLVARLAAHGWTVASTQRSDTTGQLVCTIANGNAARVLGVLALIDLVDLWDAYETPHATAADAPQWAAPSAEPSPAVDHPPGDQSRGSLYWCKDGVWTCIPFAEHLPVEFTPGELALLADQLWPLLAERMIAAFKEAGDAA